MGDYYRILEVDRSATAQEIRQAFKRLALKWHPDKNPRQKEMAEKKFKEINEAYAVLSDARKRRQYDHQAKQTSKQRKKKRFETPRRRPSERAAFHQFKFVDPEHIFEQFFNSGPFDDFVFGGGPAAASSSHSFGMNSNSKKIPTNDDIFPHPSLVRNMPHLFTNAYNGFPGASMQGNREEVPANDIFSRPSSSRDIPQFFTYAYDDISSASTNANQPKGNMKKVFSTVQFVNGKKIETRKVLENGIETTTVYENNVLKTKTVRKL